MVKTLLYHLEHPYEYIHTVNEITKLTLTPPPLQQQQEQSINQSTNQSIIQRIQFQL